MYGKTFDLKAKSPDIIIIIDLIKDYRNINLHLDLVLWTYCSVLLVIVIEVPFGLVDGIRGEGVYSYSRG